MRTDQIKRASGVCMKLLYTYTVYSKVVNFLLIWVEFQCRFMMFVIVEREFLLYTGSMVQLTEPSIHSNNTQSLNLLCPEMTANYMDWFTRSFGSFYKRKGLLTVFLYFKSGLILHFRMKWILGSFKTHQRNCSGIFLKQRSLSRRAQFNLNLNRRPKLRKK